MEKIPCIKCAPEIWEYINPYLKEWGYDFCNITSNWERYPLLCINDSGNIGFCCNYWLVSMHDYNRELVTNVEEFLEKAATLKGFAYKRKDIMKINGVTIKPGMGIYVDERIAENLYVVIPTKRGLGVIAYGKVFTWEHLDRLLEEYSARIVAICDIPNGAIEGDILWEKPQEVVLTMQDIAKKFNCPVESIRIKK